MTTSSTDPRAAVLAPVYRDGDGELRIVLIVRTDHGHHGGQLAFPGGRVDADDESHVATAHRVFTQGTKSGGRICQPILPDKIKIYRGPLERLYGADPVLLRNQIQHVVRHEVAHHFGISDQRLLVRRVPFARLPPTGTPSRTARA